MLEGKWWVSVKWNIKTGTMHEVNVWEEKWIAISIKLSSSHPLNHKWMRYFYSHCLQKKKLLQKIKEGLLGAFNRIARARMMLQLKSITRAIIKSMQAPLALLSMFKSFYLSSFSDTPRFANKMLQFLRRICSKFNEK